MMSSLSCTANPGLSGNETATLFSSVCGLNHNACIGISTNATTGKYGAYSMCSPDEQLSFAMDQYYKAQDKAATACSFGGKAKIQSSSTSDSCKKLLSQAGSDGTGVVTSTPTGSKSPGSPDNGPKKSTAGTVLIPYIDAEFIKIGAYLIGAALTGAGMILL